MKSLQLIASLTNSVSDINNTIKTEFIVLTNDQLCWKPSSISWSIVECLEHIVLSGDYYLKEISKKFNEIKPFNTPIDIQFEPGLIGNFSSNSMVPKDGHIKVKIKTLKRMRPGKSQLEPIQIIENFNNYSEETHSLLKKSQYYNLSKIKITSSLGFLIRFKLGDTFRFVIAHNQRHIQQALNVKKHADFPIV